MTNTFATPWTVAHQGSSVQGIFQARILQWVAISSSRASSLSLLHCQLDSLQLSHQGSLTCWININIEQNLHVSIFNYKNFCIGNWFYKSYLYLSTKHWQCCLNSNLYHSPPQNIKAWQQNPKSKFHVSQLWYPCNCVNFLCTHRFHAS